MNTDRQRLRDELFQEYLRMPPPPAAIWYSTGITLWDFFLGTIGKWGEDEPRTPGELYDCICDMESLAVIEGLICIQVDQPL